MTDKDGLMPNLFVIGASKTGSSSLHSYLSHHPDIAGATPKEPCFFVAPDELKVFWPLQALDPVSYDPAAYQAMFAQKPAKYRLESSVYYSQVPHMTGIPERIAAACPDARIIYVVRHPVTRTISHYWQRFRELHEKRSIDKALVEGSIFLDTSNYAAQMRAYLDHFERSRIKVILSEDLLHQRKVVLDDVFEWLGLRTLEMDAALERSVHKTKENTRIPRLGVLRSVRDSALWLKVRGFLPKTAIDRLRKLSFREVSRAEFDDTAVRAFLSDYFEERAGAFDELMDVAFEHRWFPDKPGLRRPNLKTVAEFDR